MPGDNGVWLSSGGLAGVHKSLGSVIPTYSWPLCETVSAVEVERGRGHSLRVSLPCGDAPFRASQTEP